MSAAAGRNEFEVALIVKSDAPRRITEHVAALSSIGGYRLYPEAPQPIRDLYFDTPKRALAAKHVALRLRTIGPLCYLALKGPSRRTEWGAVERLELEEPWSAGSLERILDVLRHAGVTLPRDFNVQGSPADLIRAVGLDVVQDRETQRQPSSVTRSDDQQGVVVAELAVDAVTYHFDVNVALMYQIEIEAKSAAGASAVKSIMERLVAQFAPALHPWPYGKLVTGDIIGRLLRGGALKGLLGVDNTLSPAALDRIEAVLTQEEP